MKNFLAILLTFFYFGTSSGMVYGLHYCMDDIFVTVGSTDNECNKCGTEKKKDCCKSEIRIAKTDSAQKSNPTILDLSHFAAVLPQNFFLESNKSAADPAFGSVQIKAPPEKNSPPLFLQYCNFRI